MRRTTHRLAPVWLLSLAILLASAVLLPSAAGARPDPGRQATATRATTVLRVTFVDVGQGDAIVLRSGSWTGLIDGGPSGTGPRIEAVLRKVKATHLDVLLITHPHADHIGGLAKVVRDFVPTTVVYGAEGTTATWRNLKSELTGEGATFKVVRTDDELQFGRVTAKVLSTARRNYGPVTRQTRAVGRVRTVRRGVGAEYGDQSLDVHGWPFVMQGCNCTTIPPPVLIKQLLFMNVAVGLPLTQTTVS